MSKFLLMANHSLLKHALGYIALALVWIYISIGLQPGLAVSRYDEIRGLLECKLLFLAIVFLGRFLLFARRRNRRWFWGSFMLCVLALLGAGIIGRMGNKDFSWWQWLFLCADEAAWAYAIAGLAEVFILTIRYWSLLPHINLGRYRKVWRRLWREVQLIGLWVTFLLGWLYNYLIQFFVIDTVLYSYLLLVPLLMTGFFLYFAFYLKLRSWVQVELEKLELAIVGLRRWNELAEDEYTDRLPRLHYLLLLHLFWIKIRQPVISWGTLIEYLICSGFLLGLPYIFGIAVAV